MAGYDSEQEDRPRKVLEIHGDFTIASCDLPMTFKLHELADLQRQFGPGSVLAVHPVPDPRSVLNARRAMGNEEAGVWTGTIFEAPAKLSPEFVFQSRPINTLNRVRTERFCIRRRFVPKVANLKTMAVYTDGACASNGLDAPRGGFAFVFNKTTRGVNARALEKKGPNGEAYTHTSNRAELRAVLEFLKYRLWWGEGWKRIVVITDSEYVGKGATTWLRNWARNGWRTAAGRPTANRDLWEALSDAMGSFAKAGCEISFWVVPRTWNTQADTAAKTACKEEGVEDFFHIKGILV